MIWRRLLVKSDSTIEDLHYTIQIAMGWQDLHLHYFTIHGKQYGIWQPGGMSFSDRASDVKLAQFGFRPKERFLYEYDLSTSPVKGVWRYWWRHQIRVEAIVPERSNQTYPFCTGGKGICPPENSGGAWGFMTAREEYSLLDILEVVTSFLEDENYVIDAEEAVKLRNWLLIYENKLDREQINQRLQQYATGDSKSMLFKQEILIG
jgi:hypothetical protein